MLAERAVAHAALDDPSGWSPFFRIDVASLLNSLRLAGAHEQATALASRLPEADMFGFGLFEQNGSADQFGFGREAHGTPAETDQFRFGREADGTPAAPWGWEDLDLWLVPRPRGP